MGYWSNHWFDGKALTLAKQVQVFSLVDTSVCVKKGHVMQFGWTLE